MKRNPYDRFSKKELILRDQLAIDRTVLANERTVLAYIRTALALMAAGGTVIYFSRESIDKAIGCALITAGIAIIIIGIFRYKKMQKSINKIKRS